MTFKLSRDPLSSVPGAESRKFDRGDAAIGAYSSANSGGIHKSGRTHCFNTGFGTPLDPEVERDLGGLAVGDPVEVEIDPRGAGDRRYVFHPRLMAAGAPDLKDPSSRKRLQQIGCGPPR